MTIEQTAPALPKVLTDGRLYIGGQWREATGGATTEVINPATGRPIATVAAGTTKDIDAAVAAERLAPARLESFRRMLDSGH